MDELLRDFLNESAEQVESIGSQLVRFEQDPSDARIIANIFRLVHAIKGTCGFLNLPRLERVAHAAEALVERLRDGAAPSRAMVSLILEAVDRVRMILTALGEDMGEPPGDDEALLRQIDEAAGWPANSAPPDPPAFEGALAPGPTPTERRVDTVRIPVHALERLMALVSELVLTRNQLVDVARSHDIEPLRSPLQRLSAVAADLRQSALAARMQPVERLFLNFNRLVRDLCVELGKKAELTIQGGGTELDRQLIEAIRDPLTQMLRNAIDHGIEAPEARRRAGKAETGSIRISARHQAGHVTIDVSDDGRGIDSDSIRERAAALGLASRKSLAALSDVELAKFVFMPGFTTSDRDNGVSGRGIGLDIVRANIESLGGSIALASRAGHGVKLALRIPLTLAIVPALVLRCGADVFVLPQHAVEDLADLGGDSEGGIVDLNGAKVFNADDGAIPAAYLGQLVDGGPPPPDEAAEAMILLRMRVGARAFAVLVDEVVDVQEIVLKPMPAQLRHIDLFSGCVILGDGSAALALEPAGLAAALGLPKSSGASVQPAKAAEDVPAPAKLAFFRVGDGLKALPLEAVATIQPVPGGALRVAGGQAYIPSEERLIPIVSPDGAPCPPASHADFTALVLREGEKRYALVADEIVDVVDVQIGADRSSGRRGVLGTVKLRGELAEILDPFVLSDAAFEPLRVERREGAAMRVLLQEPSPVLSLLLAQLLRGAGYEPREAGTIRQFRACLANEGPFAAILFDLDALGPKDGGPLRAEDLVNASPRRLLLGLASSAGDAARSRAAKAGFDGVVEKLDRAELLRRLASIDAPARHSESAA